MNFTGVLKTGVFKHMVVMVTITEKNTKCQICIMFRGFPLYHLCVFTYII